MSIDTRMLIRATCDRCGATKTVEDENDCDALKNWGQIDGLDQCPECARIVRDVLKGYAALASEEMLPQTSHLPPRPAPKVIP